MKDDLDKLAKDCLMDLPSELRASVEAYVTARILLFHQALIERKQIAPVDTTNTYGTEVER